MVVLLYEDNLMWSEKLRKTVVGLGHTPVVMNRPNQETPPAQVAIVNLGITMWDAAQLVKDLQARGIKVVGHAGHKEKETLQVGKEIGCDYLATNSETTFKLDKVLAQFESVS